MNQVQTRPGLGSALASLRHNPQFRLLWWSNLFFFGGAWSQTLVLGWIAYELTGSEFLVAVFTAVRLAPLLLGPLTGALADRHHRVAMLIIASGWAFLAVAVVALLASVDLLSYGAIVLGGLAIGLAQSPSQPARAALVLELVGRENLSNANALNALAMNVTQVIGPALGGAMIALLGAPTTLWISTLWYAASLLLLLPLRRYGRAVPRATERMLPLMINGFRQIGRNRLALAVLGVTLAANILIWPVYQSFMPVFARDQLGLDAAGLGVLLTCGGVGGLVGSMIIAGLGDFRHKGALFVFGTAAWGAMWVLFAASGQVVVSYLLMAAIGVFSAAFGVMQTTLLLITTDEALHGRALGLQELAIGIMPVAALVLGAIAQVVGVGPTALCSSLLLIITLAVLAVAEPRLLKIGNQSTPGQDDDGSVVERPARLS